MSWMPDDLWWSVSSPASTKAGVFKAAFAKTFSPPGSVPSTYRDQFSFGGIHMCGDKTAIFLTLLAEAESYLETSACFIPAFTIATAR